MGQQTSLWSIYNDIYITNLYKLSKLVNWNWFHLKGSLYPPGEVRQLPGFSFLTPKGSFLKTKVCRCTFGTDLFGTLSFDVVRQDDGLRGPITKRSGVLVYSVKELYLDKGRYIWRLNIYIHIRMYTCVSQDMVYHCKVSYYLMYILPPGSSNITSTF